MLSGPARALGIEILLHQSEAVADESGPARALGIEMLIPRMKGNRI